MTQIVNAQDTVVAAGPEYKASKFKQWKWGKHYRREWTTPVRAPFIFLDSIAGGLTPYEAGGGRQSESLHLRDKQGREYVLRSVDKSFGRALPDLYRGTFVENIINDQVSIAHPYAAVTIAPMAEAAGIYHTNPVIGFLPRQTALDSFNKEFGNRLYLLEQRPDENWETAPNFGYASNLISTDKLQEKLKNDNDNQVDQLAFVRARLFDLFIGDWGRHEDQWRWGEFKAGDDKKIYRPVPRDRDQAYTKFDGFLLKFALSAGGISHLQTFDYTIKDIARFNFPARHLDRLFLNKLSLDEWLRISKELQASLSDKIIEGSVKELPAELFSISGAEIISKLKSRRDHLPEFAEKYYYFLAREVDITGSEKNELFTINRLNDSITSIATYSISKNGEVSSTPFYQRTFTSSETKEIRLYGLAGEDRYTIEGTAQSGIKIRIVGGIDKDSVINYTTLPSSQLVIYDNPGNYLKTNGHARQRISADTAINAYRYHAFEFDKKGLSPIVFYDYPDRLFVGLNYKIQKQKWRREPFAHEHLFSARYSVIQNAFSMLYKGRVNEFIGKWNLDLNASYDFIRWTNFFGLGNETKMITKDPTFYRLRTRDGYASMGLSRQLGKHQAVGFAGFYQAVKIVNDTDRFVHRAFTSIDKHNLDFKTFTGGKFFYIAQYTNDPLLPSKGFDFITTISYTHNLADKEKSFSNYAGQLNVYVPLFKNFALALRASGATLSGTPEFYQYNSIGGSNSLRGYRRDRFWGQSAFYNSNELQWLFPVKTRLFNGKFGFVGLFDQGRVWMPGETSDTWHKGYGGGFILAPFNKVAVTVTYAASPQFHIIHLNFKTPLKL